MFVECKWKISDPSNFLSLDIMVPDYSNKIYVTIYSSILCSNIVVTVLLNKCFCKIYLSCSAYCEFSVTISSFFEEQELDCLKFDKIM